MTMCFKTLIVNGHLSHIKRLFIPTCLKQMFGKVYSSNFISHLKILSRDINLYILKPEVVLP